MPPRHACPPDAPIRSRSYFIAGTDTEIGKTLASCGLLRAFAAHGLTTAAMKPIAAGAAPDARGIWRNEDAEALAACATVPVPRALSTPFLLREPAAPHLVAAREGVTLDIPYIVRCHRDIAAQADITIVEGVGGFRVPLDDDLDTGHLAQALDLPVILVVGMRLGCLNHAMLTAEAIAACGLRIAGWIANTIDPAMRLASENVATLRERLARRHDAVLLGELPHLREATGEHAAAWLDIRPLVSTWGRLPR